MTDPPPPSYPLKKLYLQVGGVTGPPKYLWLVIAIKILYPFHPPPPALYATFINLKYERESTLCISPAVRIPELRCHCLNKEYQFNLKYSDLK